MRILVIDDEPTIARVLRTRLADHGVEIGLEGAAAITRVARAEQEGHPFDVVVCDYTMPITGGLEVLAAVKARRQPPLAILMSGRGDVSKVSNLADGFLEKPFTIDQLRAEIARIVDTRDQQRRRTRSS